MLCNMFLDIGHSPVTQRSETTKGFYATFSAISAV